MSEGSQAPRRGGPAEGTTGPDYGPVEFAAALRDAMARIGAAGPQAAGLIRIRRLARIRRRVRLFTAGGLGVLLAAATLSAAAGGVGSSPAPHRGGAGGFDKRETVRHATPGK